MPKKEKIKILIADKINLDSLKPLNKGKFEVKTAFGISNEEILESYSDYDVLVIRSVRRIEKDFIVKCNFKIIGTCSKGFDNIDIEAARNKKIKTLNIDEGNSISAAEHTIGLIISAMRNIVHSDKLVRAGKFNDHDFRRSELFGKKVGVIGYGNVGSYVGKLAEAFGMNVYANDIDKKVTAKYKKVNFKSLNFILKNCDIITIHIPMNKNNFHLFSYEKLNMLNKNTVLINTSRGGVIDEAALLRKLKRNDLRCVCLDVFESEPSPNKEFFKLSNVILTNHIAGKTEESAVKMPAELFKKIKNCYKK